MVVISSCVEKRINWGNSLPTTQDDIVMVYFSINSLLHPLLQAPDGVVVVGVLEAPEGPRLVTSLGAGVGHGGLQSLGPASAAAVIGGY